MKRLILSIISLVMIFSFIGCSDSSSKKEEIKSNSSIVNTIIDFAEEEEKKEVKTNNFINIFENIEKSTKPILVIIVNDKKKLDHPTKAYMRHIKSDKVFKIINKKFNFIIFEIEKTKGTIIEASLTPTTYVLNSKGTKVLNTILGNFPDDLDKLLK